MNGRPRNRGFTLVEVMLAATLTTLVIGGALASLSVMLQAYKKDRERTSNADAALAIFDRMRADLEAAFLSPHRAITRFVGTDAESNGMPADTLTFISAVNRPFETGLGTSDTAEVQYFIDEDPETPARWLQRRYDPTPDTDPFGGGMTALLGPRVVSLDLQYYDGLMWWPRWDSVQEIPMLVSIAIGIEPGGVPAAASASAPAAPPDAAALETFSTVVRLAWYREPPADSLGPVGGTAALMEEEEEGGGGGQGRGGGGR